MNLPRHDHEENKSFLEKGRRELATPQGSKLLSAFLLCGFLSILLEYIFNRFPIPKSLIYSLIIIINAVIITIYAFKIYNINKKIKEKREEKYIKKYGMKYSDFLSSKGKRGKRS